MAGPRNTIHEIDYSDPARPCRCQEWGCGEPFGDRSEGTCQRCGHQVDSRPMPDGGSFRHPGPTFARKARKPQAER